MRSYVLPARYFLLLFLIIGAMMGAMILAEIVASGTETPEFIIILESPFTNTILEQIFEYEHYSDKYSVLHNPSTSV